MMPSEFEERTGYTPSNEEYHYIEESYYDFEGNKDDFCKAWLKEKKAGFWEKELNFRKQRDGLKNAYEGIIAETEDNLKWYREGYEKQREQIKELKEQVSKLQEESEAAILKERKDLTIEFKNGEKVTKPFAEIRYIDHEGFCFINVIESNGWTESYKMDEISSITIG